TRAARSAVRSCPPSLDRGHKKLASTAAARPPHVSRKTARVGPTMRGGGTLAGSIFRPVMIGNRRLCISWRFSFMHWQNGGHRGVLERDDNCIELFCTPQTESSSFRIAPKCVVTKHEQH